MLAIGLIVLVLVVAWVLELCARAEATDVPEEPWLEWDGEIPPEIVNGEPRGVRSTVLGHDLRPGEVQEMGRR